MFPFLSKSDFYVFMIGCIGGHMWEKWSCMVVCFKNKFRKASQGLLTITLRKMGENYILNTNLLDFDVFLVLYR